jgi:hypothetical protein
MKRGDARTVTRRALIGGAVGGAAAIATRGLTGPRGALAASGDNVVLGAFNESSNTTQISNPNSGTYVTRARFAAATEGMGGISNAYQGVGVYATAGGTEGIALQAVTSGHNSQVGIDAVGNLGNGEGYAVRARTKNGIALYGEVTGTGGYGLQVIGRAVFSRSGKVTIAAGQASKTVSGYAVTAATLVVATVQGNAARYVRNVVLNDAADTFTIRLNKVAPTGGVVVGFFIVN